MSENSFDAETVHEIFKLVSRRKAQDRERGESADDIQNEAVGGASKKRSGPTTANSNALKLICEFLRIFIAEAVQRASVIAEAVKLSKKSKPHTWREFYLSCCWISEMLCHGRSAELLKAYTVTGCTTTLMTRPSIRLVYLLDSISHVQHA